MEVLALEGIPGKTLMKIEMDIENQDLGRARDRLHGLISTYPNELKLRRRLGDVYHLLQYPAMAGRYWYLELDKTADMVSACSEFEKAMGKDPVRIARAVKFKGDCDLISDPELRKIVARIQKDAEKEGLEDFGEFKETWGDKLFLVGCISVVLITLFFIVLGVYQFNQWIW
ncbi:DUF6584 family protein [Edaphobacillus lindanitolerans]